MFKEYSLGLNFTCELPTKGCLQFLDLRLHLEPGHLCWEYFRRSAKPLLNFSSGHSMLVKNGIAFSVLRSAVFKSCMHKTGNSFQAQITRLVGSGFPEHLMHKTAQKLIKIIGETENSRKDGLGAEKMKNAVIPYIHRLSHGLKNVAGRYGVRVLFSAPNKLGKMCNMVERGLSGQKSIRYCNVKHA